MQNLALTLALISLSFNNKFSIVVYSYIFGLMICLECALFVLFIRIPIVRRLLCGFDPIYDIPAEAAPAAAPGAEKELATADDGKGPTAHDPREATVMVAVTPQKGSKGKKGWFGKAEVAV